MEVSSVFHFALQRNLDESPVQTFPRKSVSGENEAFLGCAESAILNSACAVEMML